MLVPEILTTDLTVAALLAALGLALCGHSLVLAKDCRRHAVDPERALALARGTRVAIAGLSVLAFAGGWYWGLTWLMVLAAIIFGEELLETTVIVMALREGQALRRAAADR